MVWKKLRPEVLGRASILSGPPFPNHTDNTVAGPSQSIQLILLPSVTPAVEQSGYLRSFRHLAQSEA